MSPRESEPFAFPQEVESAAHKRQEGLCAACGTTVAWSHSPSHAVFPILGSEGGTSRWKKEAENCVLLCNGCYFWIHDDAQPPVTGPTGPEDFKYSHGKTFGEHRIWATRLMGR